MIVADANVIIYLVRDSSFTHLAREVHARDSHWVAPRLWQAEVLNGLLREVQAGHLGLAEAILAASHADAVLKGRERESDPAAVLRTAHASCITAYDACYVSLARALGVPLITEDAQILRRCSDVARSLRAFLGAFGGPAGVRERQATYRVRSRRPARAEVPLANR